MCCGNKKKIKSTAAERLKNKTLPKTLGKFKNRPAIVDTPNNSIRSEFSIMKSLKMALPVTKDKKKPDKCKRCNKMMKKVIRRIKGVSHSMLQCTNKLCGNIVKDG